MTDLLKNDENSHKIALYLKKSRNNDLSASFDCQDADEMAWGTTPHALQSLRVFIRLTSTPLAILALTTLADPED